MSTEIHTDKSFNQTLNQTVIFWRFKDIAGVTFSYTDSGLKSMPYIILCQINLIHLQQFESYPGIAAIYDSTKTLNIRY